MANFTLELLHAADQEAGIPALDDAPRFSAVLNALKAQDLGNDGIDDNTIVLSSGDAIIPGLFFSASAEVLGGAGRADILIQNELGFQAIAFGNHEFDQGTELLADLIGGATDEGFAGTQFPYLSGNLDFSSNVDVTDEDGNLIEGLADFVVEDAQAPQPNSIAASIVIDVNGELIGVVGATTPTLPTISSPGDVTVLPQSFDGVPTPEQLDALAAEIQADVDALLAANPDVNKVVLLAHMQQISIEQQLAERLSNVDIIVAGGSNTRLLDETDRLRDGDTEQGVYPIIKTDADGNPVAVVNTDGNYKYVGRLVIDFDENGVIIPESYDPAVSGAYATDFQGVADLGAEGLVDPEIQAIVDALRENIVANESNFFGLSDVYLDGIRSSVRTEETNLGNLTADANLATAKEVDPTTVISLKNGGGIRDDIGQQIVPTGSVGEVIELPTEAVTDADGNIVKPAGGISQNDIANSLRFNNGLTLLTVTAEELAALIEHGVAESSLDPTVQPGRFPQVSGVSFSFDVNQPAGDRIQSLAVTNEAGNILDVVIENGELVGDANRTFRMVTLGFLADGGDGYPFPTGESANRVDLNQTEEAPRTGDATFAPDGSEQDALAEYLFDNFFETPFAEEDTDPSGDTRIQNLAFREDTVLGEGLGTPPTPIDEPDFSGGLEGPFTKIGGLELEDGAEINAFDPVRQVVYVVSGSDVLQVVDLSDPSNPTPLFSIDVEAEAGVPIGGINSVAYKNNVLALAVEADTVTDPGFVVLVDLDTFADDPVGSVNALPVGALPDMVTFTPDGNKVLVANEGEPNFDYSVDPEGSVSIIDLSNGVENAIVTPVEFTDFNDRKAELQATGVKLFGLNATVAQDLEPEYIATSADGSTAWVTLQENNAVAVIDIESATVEGILPLGFKDFSKGQPELTSYNISDRGPITNGGDALVTATGETVELGGFSGLWFDGVADNGNLKFLSVPDRGPNGDVTDGNRPFLLPDYQARVLSLELNESTGEVSITNELLLTRADGTPITGLPNIPEVDERAVDAAGNFVDLDFLDGFDTFGTDYDPLGADLEGIVRAPDDTYWMVDEYRPAIYHFDANGALINRFVPEGTVDQANAANSGADFAPGTFGTETLPAEYFNRRPNRGFEGMALDTDEGILYAFIQTPLSNPTEDDGAASNVIRMLGIDPATGTPVAEYVYLLQKPDVGGNVDKIGDAVYAGDGRFFVMERDSSLESTAQKFVFEVDLKGVTNVLGMDFGGETLEQQTADDLEAMGINPVNKVKVTNLPSLGYLPSDKPEGLAYLPDGRLAVLNDNDFGLVPGAEGVELGLIDFADGNTFDASNEDGAINLQNWPVFGTYQPDSIASYEVDGVTYYVTANEGDARIRPDGDIEDENGEVLVEEGAFFNEEARIKDVVLDSTAFPNAEELQLDENLGRLNITTALGDTDGDGDFDELYAYGARSFSIWDENGNLVFDSGDAIANITAQLTPDFFNANDGDPEEFDQRSDDKGAEPEALTIGKMGDTTYAFVGLERAGGGVVAYDISDPFAPEFVQYFRDDADIAPEGLSFIPAVDSPNGKNLLLVTNEESSTLTVYAAEPELEADAPSPAPAFDELLDLTGFDGDVMASVTVSREAAFDNLLQFYQTDAKGTVGGLKPGDAGYEDAVRANLLDIPELFVENLVTEDLTIMLAGGTYYAPALLVNGNSNNLVTIDDAVTGMAMIQREGSVWSFEDLRDFDFNDLVFTLNSAEAAA
jgi:2',3'-cyclic-nucleotide 2'-phosphodiesterase (5'-nucleotidase family)